MTNPTPTAVKAAKRFETAVRRSTEWWNQTHDAWHLPESQIKKFETNAFRWDARAEAQAAVLNVEVGPDGWTISDNKVKFL